MRRIIEGFERVRIEDWFWSGAGIGSVSDLGQEQDADSIRKLTPVTPLNTML